MALSSLTGQIGSFFSAVPEIDLTGAVYNPVATSLSINKRLSVSTASNNNTNTRTISRATYTTLHT